EEPGGRVDQRKTDLYMHLVNRKDHSILPVDQVLRVIDDNVDKLNQLFKDYNVLDSAASRPRLLESESQTLLILYLGGATALLAILLALTVGICIHQRVKFSRQLRAATATAFGSHASGLDGLPRTSHAPNTNIHAVEGSNPVWLHGYDNEWFKQEAPIDNSQTDSQGGDSLDENAVLEDRSLPSTAYVRDFEPHFTR
ncbi:unnamed protein product, partial [Darwinula stevensoni]